MDPRLHKLLLQGEGTLSSILGHMQQQGKQKPAPAASPAPPPAAAPYPQPGYGATPPLSAAQPAGAAVGVIRPCGGWGTVVGLSWMGDVGGVQDIGPER